MIREIKKAAKEESVEIVKSGTLNGQDAYKVDGELMSKKTMIERYKIGMLFNFDKKQYEEDVERNKW